MNKVISHYRNRVMVHAVAASLAMSACAWAEGFDQQMQAGVAAMDGGEWGKAVGLFESLGKELEGGSAFQQGAILYHQGYALLQRGMELRKAGEVKKSRADVEKSITLLERCAALAGEGEDRNIYRVRALFYLGAASQSLENYDTALKHYEDFLLNRNQLRDEYDQGAMSINLVVCHSLKSEPDLAAAMTAFKSTLSNQERWSISDASIARAMHSLVVAHLKVGDSGELLDFFKSQKDQMAKVFCECGESVEFLAVAASLASDGDRQELAVWLLSLLPAVQDVMQEYDGLSSVNEAYKGDDDFLTKLINQRIKKELSPREEQEKDDHYEVKALELFAYLAEQRGCIALARMLYLSLESDYVGSEYRERDLVQLVRLSAVMKDDEAAILYGERFLDSFENSEQVVQVRMMLADVFYQNEEYAKVTSLYRDVLSKAANLSEGEVVLAIRSAYKGADYEEVLRLYEVADTQDFDEVGHMEVDYYKASSLNRLQKWEAAILAIDTFINAYGVGNEFAPVLQYEKADSLYALLQVDEAKVLLGGLIKEHAGTKVQADSYNLLGLIQQATRERDEARESFQSALELAREMEDVLLEQESLFYLVSLLGQESINGFKNKEVKEALPYFDQFFEKYKESEYAAQVAVAGMAAMKEADRFDEFEFLLGEVIFHMAENERTPGLELAVDTYFWVLQERGRTFSEVRSSLSSLHVSGRAMAVFKDGLSRAYARFTDKAGNEKDGARSSLNDVRRRMMMLDLRRDYPLKELPPYVMLNLANYLVEETETPEGAKPYYEAVIERGSIAEGIEASYGLASLLFSAADEESLSQANRLLADVVSRTRDDELRDHAQALQVEIAVKQESWQDVTERAKQYLLVKSNDRNRARVSYLQAYSYDRRGMVEDAIAFYGQVYGNYLHSLEVSAPAADRLTELTWERNKKGSGPASADRQVAYQLAHRYLSLTREAFESGQDDLRKEVVEAWKSLEKNVQRWEQSGEIKTVEQLLEDRRKGRKSF